MQTLLSRLTEQQVSVSAALASAKKFGEDAAANLDSGDTCLWQYRPHGLNTFNQDTFHVVTRDIAGMTMKLFELQQQIANQQNINQSIQSQVTEKMLEKQLLAQKVVCWQLIN